uniref:Uncharacterized protein n=1 Tax=Lepeophtheirus salmonis TaxID=72036 RepID=A0A0K2UAN0_LEPSM
MSCMEYLQHLLSKWFWYNHFLLVHNHAPHLIQRLPIRFVFLYLLGQFVFQNSTLHHDQHYIFHTSIMDHLIN